jgi:hypothetical protein
MSDRRSFIKQFSIAVGLLAAPEVLRVAARVATPAPSALFVSIGAKRAGWMARCLRLGARVRTIRAAAVATGVTASAALKAVFRFGSKVVWRESILRPSLRNLTDNSVRG